MPPISLVQAEALLATWLAAEAMVASGQAYQIANRLMRHADVKRIDDRVTCLSGTVMGHFTPGGRGSVRIRNAGPVAAGFCISAFSVGNAACVVSGFRAVPARRTHATMPAISLATAEASLATRFAAALVVDENRSAGAC
jgi:hypothetical protein